MSNQETDDDDSEISDEYYREMDALMETFEPFLEIAERTAYYFTREAFANRLKRLNVRTLEGLGALSKEQIPESLDDCLYHSCEFLRNEGVEKFLALAKQAKEQTVFWYLCQLKLARENAVLRQNRPDFVRCIVTKNMKNMELPKQPRQASEIVPSATAGEIHVGSYREALSCWNNILLKHSAALINNPSLHEPWLASGVLELFYAYPTLAMEWQWHAMEWREHRADPPVLFFIMCGFPNHIVNKIKSISDLTKHPFGFERPPTWYIRVAFMMDMASRSDTRIPVDRLRSFLQRDFLCSESISHAMCDIVNIIKRLVIYRYDECILDEVINNPQIPVQELDLGLNSNGVPKFANVILKENCQLIAKLLPFLRSLYTTGIFDFEGFLELMNLLSEPSNSIQKLETLGLYLPYFKNQLQFERAANALESFVKTKSKALRNLRVGQSDDTERASMESSPSLVESLLCFIASSCDNTRHESGIPKKDNKGQGSFSLETLTLGLDSKHTIDSLRVLASRTRIRKISLFQPLCSVSADCVKGIPPSLQHHPLEESQPAIGKSYINHLVVENDKVIPNCPSFWAPLVELEHLSWNFQNRKAPTATALDGISQLPGLKSLTLVAGHDCCSYSRPYNGKVDLTNCLDTLLRNAPIKSLCVADVPKKCRICENDNMSPVCNIKLKVLCDGLLHNNTLESLLLCRANLIGAKESFPAFLLDLVDWNKHNKVNLGYAQLYDDHMFYTPMSKLDKLAWKLRNLSRPIFFFEDEEEEEQEQEAGQGAGLETVQATEQTVEQSTQEKKLGAAKKKIEKEEKLLLLLNVNRYGRGKLNQEGTTIEDLIPILSKSAFLSLDDTAGEISKESEFCNDMIKLVSEESANPPWHPIVAGISEHRDTLSTLSTLYEKLLEENTLEFWVFMMLRNEEWFTVQHGLLLASPSLWAGAYSDNNTKEVTNT